MTEHVINLDQLASIRDGSGHSIFGASGSAMFLNCTGSLIPNLLAHDPGNFDASRGSIAHSMTEMHLMTGRSPRHMLGKTLSKDGFDVEIDEIMLQEVEEVVDRCEWEPGNHLIEYHGDYSDLTPIPNQGGTLDFAAMRWQECVVHDHKYGKAEQVFAERNTQLMLYAYMLLRQWDWLYDFQRFIIRIAQPRLDHFDEWVCSREELLEFVAWAKVRMHEAWTLDAPRTAGEKQCKYCKVRMTCTAYARWHVTLTDGVFGDTTQPTTVEEMSAFKDRLTAGLSAGPLSAGSLETEHIVALYRYRKHAKRFWEALAAELFRRAQEGADLTAYDLKLVESRSHRKFIDPEEASQKLAALGVPFDEIITESIISPSAAEEKLRAAGHRRKDLPQLLEGLTTKPPGKPTLAPLSDRRPALVDLSDLVFEDQTNPETDDDGDI